MKRLFITLCLKGTSQVLSYVQRAKTTHVLLPTPHAFPRLSGDWGTREDASDWGTRQHVPMGLSDCLIQMLQGLLVYAVWPPNKVVKALREDMYKQTIPAPYVAGTRAKSVNFTDGVGLSSSRWQNSAKNLVNLTLALWCGKTTTSLMPCQCTSPALPVPKWNLYSLDNEV